MPSQAFERAGKSSSCTIGQIFGLTNRCVVSSYTPAAPRPCFIIAELLVGCAPFGQGFHGLAKSLLPKDLNWCGNVECTLIETSERVPRSNTSQPEQTRGFFCLDYISFTCIYIYIYIWAVSGRICRCPRLYGERGRTKTVFF